MMVHYMLDGHTPVECHSWQKWVKWVRYADRTVALHSFDGYYGATTTVSTIFTGADEWDEANPRLALLFETMVLGGVFEGTTRRYALWDEAETGHYLMLKRCKDVDQVPGNKPLEQAQEEVARLLARIMESSK